jgi:hypothetical protein
LKKFNLKGLLFSIRFLLKYILEIFFTRRVVPLNLYIIKRCPTKTTNMLRKKSSDKIFKFGWWSMTKAIIDKEIAIKKLLSNKTAEAKFQLLAFTLFIAPIILIIKVKEVKI